MVAVVDTGGGGAVFKMCERKGKKKTSGESFVLFVICFVELDSVGILWKQTQMVKNSEIAEQSTENEIS